MASPPMLKTLVVDLDETLVHTLFKCQLLSEKAPPKSTHYKRHEDDMYIVYVNHVLVDLITRARAQSVKIVLWTRGSDTYMKEILKLAQLAHLFDAKLHNGHMADGDKKTLRTYPTIIPHPALIIDDKEENVRDNDEYLVVDNFMEQTPDRLQQEYQPVYGRLVTK